MKRDDDLLRNLLRNMKLAKILDMLSESIGDTSSGKFVKASKQLSNFVKTEKAKLTCKEIKPTKKAPRPKDFAVVAKIPEVKASYGSNTNHMEIHVGDVDIRSQNKKSQLKDGDVLSKVVKADINDPKYIREVVQDTKESHAKGKIDVVEVSKLSQNRGRSKKGITFDGAEKVKTPDLNA